MTTVISTAGLPQFSEAEKAYKLAIENAIDTAGLVTMSAATATNDGYLDKDDFATFDAKQTAILASGKILIGSASNVATAQTPTGIVTLSVAGATAITCADGKILVGNASNVAEAQTVSGVVTLANTGAFGFSTNYFNVATTSSNGELTIANMTSNGGVIVLPRSDVGTNGPITHQTAAAGKVTLFYDGSTNVAASLSVAYAVVKL